MNISFRWKDVDGYKCCRILGDDHYHVPLLSKAFKWGGTPHTPLNGAISKWQHVFHVAVSLLLGSDIVHGWTKLKSVAVRHGNTFSCCCVPSVGERYSAQDGLKSVAVRHGNTFSCCCVPSVGERYSAWMD